MLVVVVVGIAAGRLLPQADRNISAVRPATAALADQLRASLRDFVIANR
ncbi:MAG: hypothetical protein M0T79_06715 [Actinomycetota bacterium]|nr:hypothetical protein [Actinomycetota bacterium]